MSILNLTQHPATPDQTVAGVVNLSDNTELKKLLTFTSLPTKADIESKAQAIAKIALDNGANKAMIAGAGYLMPALERELKTVGITPLHAFSERVSVETANADGTVSKQNTFKHVGFIEA